MELWESLAVDLKYAGYITRQETSIHRLRASEEKRIPAEFDFGGLLALRAETRQKLAAVRPETLGQAARISGVTTADVALLSILVQRST